MRSGLARSRDWTKRTLSLHGCRSLSIFFRLVHYQYILPPLATQQKRDIKTFNTTATKTSRNRCVNSSYCFPFFFLSCLRYKYKRKPEEKQKEAEMSSKQKIPMPAKSSTKSPLGRVVWVWAMQLANHSTCNMAPQSEDWILQQGWRYLIHCFREKKTQEILKFSSFFIPVMNREFGVGVFKLIHTLNYI